MWIYSCLKYVLFKLDPEIAHRLALRWLKFRYPAHRVIKKQQVVENPISVFGLNFPNPVGLAAGFDKNADCVDALCGLGFGFIEVGTVTPTPQPGNPKPRLFRLPKHLALINRMGFNNQGVDHLVRQLKHRKTTGIVGVNIGKNYTTSLEAAASDYLICYEKVYPWASYVTINVSSPNTPGLQQLQSAAYLDNLLEQLSEKKKKLREQHHRNVPLVVKISPDLDDQDLTSLVEIVKKYGIEGVIATNTTKQRFALQGAHTQETGGLSGLPLHELALKTVTKLRDLLEEQAVIIACGGILEPSQARDFLKAGAKLVQLYTGLVYRGPSLVQEIHKQLL